MSVYHIWIIKQKQQKNMGHNKIKSSLVGTVSHDITQPFIQNIRHNNINIKYNIGK